jgi:hypothetical protein
MDRSRDLKAVLILYQNDILALKTGYFTTAGF